MANCASCGATSAAGAPVCESCGRPFAPPPPPVVPPAAPPAAPAAPPVAPPAAPPVAPGHPPGYAPPPPAPPAAGSWGAGTPYVQSPPVHRLLTGPDWRPAFKAAVAPTAVLLLAALVAAVPSDYQYDYRFRSPGFGDRFGATLSLALNALGAPFELGSQTPLIRGHAERMDLVLRMAPMTVTLLWCLALWFGLRAGLHRRKAAQGQLTRGQAAGEALRTAVVLAGVTTVLWAVGGTTWQPQDAYDLPDYTGGTGRDLGRSVVTAGAGWPEAAGWTVLLAGLLAFAVYGTDALRWAAWRNRSVRGWAVAALTAGRVMAVSVALSAAAAFVLVAADSTDGGQIGLSLAVLPNLGLTLLGFGSGATFRVHSDASGAAGVWSDPSPDFDLSFFDLHDGVSADWRWAGLLALFAAGTLGWTAYRRQLDAADRLRLAAVYAVALSALMALAGAMMTRTSSTAGWSGTSDLAVSRENSIGLVFLSVLAANAAWAAVGALLLPPLLASVRGGGTGAGYAVAGYAEAPHGGAPYAPVPPQVPYGPTPPHGTPVPGVPGYGPAPQDAPPAAGAGVGEVLGSDGVPAAPAGSPAPAVEAPPAEVPRPRDEEPVDPSVWREHP
ncbi:hypothetical protein ACFQ6N_14440 [Kitasatospora sp. NPDC056446]|uniref:hypothetical protein n=1 Tax=Kitasatospora sp. NPDC056446 TaxID=3345819 RepID=UPI00367C3850